MADSHSSPIGHSWTCSSKALTVLWLRQNQNKAQRFFWEKILFQTAVNSAFSFADFFTKTLPNSSAVIRGQRGICTKRSPSCETDVVCKPAAEKSCSRAIAEPPGLLKGSGPGHYSLGKASCRPLREAKGKGFISEIYSLTIVLCCVLLHMGTALPLVQTLKVGTKPKMVSTLWRCKVRHYVAIQA